MVFKSVLKMLKSAMKLEFSMVCGVKNWSKLGQFCVTYLSTFRKVFQYIKLIETNNV